MILQEMHMFLGGVQKITEALAKPDMVAVAAAARNMGQKMVRDVSPALRAKLPQAFRQLGFSVHGEFDQIALDADNLKDVSQSQPAINHAAKMRELPRDLSNPITPPVNGYSCAPQGASRTTPAFFSKA